ncbi:MAG: aminotransferase class V-fold PLP-dependent enzyme [Rhodobacteraceae bacterium]|nr:aminotransferase class V-fold PLP-dependent enzyme [Paracoccaceae bacterium]
MASTASLKHGMEYLAIPGPSVMPDAVLRAMHRAAPNIYQGEIVTLTESVVADLRKVARCPDGHVAIYIGNGHAAWEAALANTLAPGELALVPATGRFGHGWADMAQGLGIETQILDFGKQSPIDLDRIAATLRADTGHQIKAVLATHVDTSTSIRNDIAALRAVMDDLGHPALLMADCIASLACDRFEMQDWGVDVMVAGSQKGLMVPPGLGLVFFSDKAAEKRRTMPRVSRYWDWVPRSAPQEFYQYFNGTAPTHHLYGMRVALDMLLEEGMEQVWARHDILAQAIWAACDGWSRGGALKMNVADPVNRSRAVTSLSLPTPQASELRSWLEAQMGLTLGIGLGMAEPGDPARDGFFRLGHMGHVNGHMIMGLLGGVDAGLRALGIPTGQGALEGAADVMAAHAPALMRRETPAAR